MRTTIALALLCHTLLPGLASGQFRAAGLVRDSLGTPITGATITTADASTLSDSLGRFSLRLTRIDSTTVTVRKLGFASVTITMATDSLALNDLDIQLDAVARSMPGVDVKEVRYARVPTIENFEARRRERAGLGFFLSRDEILKREGAPLSSLLSQARGVSIIRGPHGRMMLRFARWSSKGTACAPHVWIDGTLARNFEIDDMRAADVQALELYANASSAPAEFDTAGRFACGVVAIWTRRPIIKDTP